MEKNFLEKEVIRCTRYSSKPLSDFRLHPIYSRFLRFENPLKIGELIEKELDSKVIFSHEKLIFTEQWLIERSNTDFLALHSSEIIWVYHIETSHSLNFLPTGEITFSIKIHSMLKNTKNKIIFVIQPSKSRENAMNCLLIIQKFAPWALYGYNEQLNELWEKNPEIMVQKVNRSYQQYFDTK